MPQMSQGDALILAGNYASYAEDIVQYQADHGGEDDVDQGALATMVSAVTQHSKTLANDAMATIFNDTAGAAQQLQKATADATADLASLSSQVNTYSRVADITAGVINIGVGLATRNPGAVLKAAVGLAASVAKDNP
jgi:hypothetical protein